MNQMNPIVRASRVIRRRDDIPLVAAIQFFLRLRRTRMSDISGSPVLLKGDSALARPDELEQVSHLGNRFRFGVGPFERL